MKLSLQQFTEASDKYQVTIEQDFVDKETKIILHDKSRSGYPLYINSKAELQDLIKLLQKIEKEIKDF